MLTMNQAKAVVQESFDNYNGFVSVLPADLLFCWAGNVRFNGWTDAELVAQFKLTFELVSGTEFSICQRFIK
jgi:hypothetical protein